MMGLRTQLLRPYAGGNPNNSSNAGLGYRNGNNSRSNTNMNIVFRVCRSLQNPESYVPRAAKRTGALASANFRGSRRFKGIPTALFFLVGI